MSVETITGEARGVVDELNGFDDPNVLSSMSVAGMITLARNVNVLLRDGGVSDQDKSRLVRAHARPSLPV